MFFLLFVMLVMFGSYIYIKKKKKTTEKWGRGVNCEEEMKEKNEMSEEGCVWWGRRKKKGKGVHGWWGKKKGKRKRKKKWGVGFTYMVGKNGEWKRKKKKNLKGKKTKLVLFVCSLCLVQSVEL
jgi:hypothetical protein